MLAIDTGYITRVLQDLVRINSVNPRPRSVGAGRARRSRSTSATRWRRSAPRSRYHEPQPGRVSVVARLRGSRRAGR